jgi:phosphoribosylformylglycinamidine synthase
LLEDLLRFVEDGRPVLGICNGFQILARLGLLGEVGLAANEGGRFQCRWVSLRVDGGRSIFLRGLEMFDLSIANGQGRVVIAPTAAEDVLGRAPLRYRENPNGSAQDIAGVCNPMGNVFGLMPHPERFVERHHHPRWTAGWGVESEPAGLAIFRNAIQYVQEEL